MSISEHGIDLNVSTGLTPGDVDLLSVASSVNIPASTGKDLTPYALACVAEATARGVAVGALLQYPRTLTARRAWEDISPEVLSDTVTRQVIRVRSALDASGDTLAHVRLDEALRADAERYPDIADAVIRGILRAGASPVTVLGTPGSVLEHVCEESGIDFTPTGIADVIYSEALSVQPVSPQPIGWRSEQRIAQQAVRMVVAGEVVVTTGQHLPLQVASLTFDGNVPAARQYAEHVRAVLDSLGVHIACPWASASRSR
jgi:lactam utilization protein B